MKEFEKKNGVNNGCSFYQERKQVNDSFLLLDYFMGH